MSLRQAISAGIPRKALRDRYNRWRFGAQAPQSDECIHICPADVTDWYLPDPANGAPNYRRRHSGMVQSGDWDQSRRPFGPHLKLDSLTAHFCDGVPWEDTPLFENLMKQIENGGRPDECASREDLLARYAQLDVVFAEAQKTGQLRPHGSVNATRREQGGILIHITRNGTPLRAGGGMHRFAIARILNLASIPAQLGVIHIDAVRTGVMHHLRTPA